MSDDAAAPPKPAAAPSFSDRLSALEKKFDATVDALLQGGNLHSAGEEQLRAAAGRKTAEK